MALLQNAEVENTAKLGIFRPSRADLDEIWYNVQLRGWVEEVRQFRGAGVATYGF